MIYILYVVLRKNLDINVLKGSVDIRSKTALHVQASFSVTKT